MESVSLGSCKSGLDRRSLGWDGLVGNDPTLNGGLDQVT